MFFSVFFFFAFILVYVSVAATICLPSSFQVVRVSRLYRRHVPYSGQCRKRHTHTQKTHQFICKAIYFDPFRIQRFRIVVVVDFVDVFCFRHSYRPFSTICFSSTAFRPIPEAVFKRCLWTGVSGKCDFRCRIAIFCVTLMRNWSLSVKFYDCCLFFFCVFMSRVLNIILHLRFGFFFLSFFSRVVSFV